MAPTAHLRVVVRTEGLPHVARQRTVGRELVLAPAAPRCGERDAVSALRALPARPGEQRGDQGEDHQHGHEYDDDLEAHVEGCILLTFAPGINPRTPSTAAGGARKSTASTRAPRIRRSSGAGPPGASDRAAAADRGTRPGRRRASRARRP